MMSSYKSAKEAFVSDTIGSSVSHVNSISLVALSTILLHSAVETRLKDSSEHQYFKPGALFSLFFSEFGILVLPLLLSMTVFAARPLLLGLIIAFPAALIIALIPSHLSKIALLPTPTSHLGHAHSGPSSPPPTPTPNISLDTAPQNHTQSFPAIETVDNLSTSVELERKFKSHMVLIPVPYLTTYRSHMILMTVIAILAVDFPIFPRYLAKCESFGVSLMDLGVGSFVFAQGIGAAIPLIKDPSSMSGPTMPKAAKATRKVLPLLALGLARVLFVKGTAYPEHVTEYGVHWNFFITMALLAPLSVLLHPIIKRFSIALVALSLASVHEILLQVTSLQAWALSGKRTSLISQNKEGLVSLPGYLAIHTFGLLMGALLLPPSPSTFRRMQRQQNVALDARDPPSSETVACENIERRQPDKAAIELFSYAMAWWSLLGVVALSLPLMTTISGSIEVQHKSTISRRLANLPYVLWVAAYNTSFLLGYLILDTLFFHVPGPDKFPYIRKSSMSRERSPVRSDRGPEFSPTEAAAAAHSQSHAPPAPEVAETDDSSPPIPRPTRTPSKHALYNSNVENTEGDATSYFVSYRGLTQVTSLREQRTPELLKAINLNGLPVFLLANVLTGVVNLSVQTMFTSDPTAMGILAAYSAIICSAAWAARNRRLW